MIKWYKVFPSIDEALEKVPENKLQKVNTPIRTVCLTRVGIRFHVFENLCPHSGASLSDGALNFKQEIVCPLHSYCFDIKVGTESNNKCRDLEIFKTQSDETGFYIGIW